MSQPAPVFACILSAMTSEQRARHRHLVQQWREVGQRQELPGGYAFLFEPSNDLALSLMEFVTLERLCCPFLRLAVEFEPDGGPLRLSLTGPEGVKPFLVHELGLDEHA